jgi:hypothetical protein
MIYKFRIHFEENDKFSMDIEIKSTQTFFDLHCAIQEEAEWDNSQLASFFVCNDYWERDQEISLLDMSDGENAKPVVMDTAVIKDYIKELKQKLVYVFDFFSDRYFFIELIDIKQENLKKHFPVCSGFTGEVPQQIKFSKTKASKNLFMNEFDNENDDFYDENEEDEFDEDLDKDLDENEYYDDRNIEEE